VGRIKKGLFTSWAFTGAPAIQVRRKPVKKSKWMIFWGRGSGMGLDGRSGAMSAAPATTDELVFAFQFRKVRIKAQMREEGWNGEDRERILVRGFVMVAAADGPTSLPIPISARFR
jgi:hypothetical protein